MRCGRQNASGTPPQMASQGAWFDPSSQCPRQSPLPPPPSTTTTKMPPQSYQSRLQRPLERHPLVPTRPRLTSLLCVCVCHLLFAIPLHAARRAMAAACRCPRRQQPIFPPLKPNPVPNRVRVLSGLPDLLPPMNSLLCVEGNPQSPYLILGTKSICLQSGFHPACLKSSNGFVLPKTGKTDTTPRSFRAIVLDSFSNILEKVVQARLSTTAHIKGLVSVHQAGSLPAEDAAARSRCGSPHRPVCHHRLFRYKGWLRQRFPPNPPRPPYLPRHPAYLVSFLIRPIHRSRCT